MAITVHETPMIKFLPMIILPLTRKNEGLLPVVVIGLLLLQFHYALAIYAQDLGHKDSAGVYVVIIGGAVAVATHYIKNQSRIADRFDV